MPRVPAQAPNLPAVGSAAAKILVGEGDDEVIFFNAFLSHLGVSDVQVEKCGGKDKLRLYLRDLKRRPGGGMVTSVGVTRDADVGCNGAFRSVADALKAAGFPQPTGPGQFASSGSIKVGVFILPDNRSAGMLENLCLASIGSHPAFGCLNQFFDCVSKAGGNNPTNIAKAHVHAWLATQAEPSASLGLAAQKKFWPFDDPAFQHLRDFLRAL
jgi:hypothetical protein